MKGSLITCWEDEFALTRHPREEGVPAGGDTELGQRPQDAPCVQGVRGPAW